MTNNTDYEWVEEQLGISEKNLMEMWIRKIVHKTWATYDVEVSESRGTTSIVIEKL